MTFWNEILGLFFWRQRVYSDRVFGSGDRLFEGFGFFVNEIFAVGFFDYKIVLIPKVIFDRRVLVRVQRVLMGVQRVFGGLECFLFVFDWGVISLGVFSFMISLFLEALSVRRVPFVFGYGKRADYVLIFSCIVRLRARMLLWVNRAWFIVFGRWWFGIGNLLRLLFGFVGLGWGTLFVLEIGLSKESSESVFEFVLGCFWLRLVVELFTQFVEIVHNWEFLYFFVLGLFQELGFIIIVIKVDALVLLVFRQEAVLVLVH